MADARRGILAGVLDDPLFNIGVGLLSQGPSTMPVSLGQGLAQGVQLAQQGQQRRQQADAQALRNQAARASLEDSARRRRAINQLGGLLGQQGGPQGEMMGLLAQVAPGATVQGLLGQMNPRSNATLDILRAAGIDPASEEGRALITSKFGGGLDAVKQQLEVLKLQADLRSSAKEETQKELDLEQATVGSADTLVKLADIVPRISIGRGISDPRGLLADTQSFNALAQSEAIDSAIRTLGQQGGVSATELNAVIGTKPRITNLPEVNAGIVADRLEALKRFARRAKVPIGDTARIDQAIEAMRAFAKSRRKPTTSGAGRVFSPQQVPALGQRRKGDVLNHPTRGRLRWTGQVWEAAE